MGVQNTISPMAYYFSLPPRQVLQWDNNAMFEQKGFSINFHEDFIKGTELAHQIKKYGFFSYSVNEALHLSPKEERQLELIVENLEIEYQNNQDASSKDIIISHLSTLLKYAHRFYERQFLNRKELSTDLLDQFNRQLEDYFNSGQLQIEGIPSIEQIADGLSVSQRYLSDTLKKRNRQDYNRTFTIILDRRSQEYSVETQIKLFPK